MSVTRCSFGALVVDFVHKFIAGVSPETGATAHADRQWIEVKCPELRPACESWTTPTSIQGTRLRHARVNRVLYYCKRITFARALLRDQFSSSKPFEQVFVQTRRYRCKIENERRFFRMDTLRRYDVLIKSRCDVSHVYSDNNCQGQKVPTSMPRRYSCDQWRTINHGCTRRPYKRDGQHQR